MKLNAKKSTRRPSSPFLKLSMQLSVSLFASFGASLGSQALAAVPVLPPTVDDATCATSKDVHEVPSRFTEASKSLAGKCLNSDHYRAVHQLTVSGSKVSFFNYLYKNTYWKAEVDLAPGAIDAVFFHIKRFPIIKGIEAAHTQVRYKMAAGHKVMLTNQLTGETAQNDDILMSFEGALDAGGKYNFAYGAFYNYALVGRVGDAATIVAQAPKTVEQYELALSDEERSQLLVSQLQRSEKAGSHVFYNTLRPNCTTEIFDRLDDLSRIKGKFERFLTVISNDPIAAPSISALQARGLIKQRVQDLADDVAGKKAILEIPKTQQLLPPFLPSVNGSPWSLVLVTPDAATLSTSENQAIASLRKEIVARSLRLFQSYAGSTMLAGVSGKSGSELLLKALGDLQGELQEVLKKADDQMPANLKTLAVYFVPMRPDGSRASLERFGLEASIPFKVQERTVDASNSASKEVLYWVGEGAMGAADSGSKLQLPAYLMSTAIVIAAQKGNSVVTTQALVGLNASDKPFSSVNEQVAIDTVKIPSGETRSDRSALLITHRQVVREPLEKNIALEFGPVGGLAGTMDMTRFATLQLLKPLNASGADCQVRASSVPQLKGVFGEKASGIALVDKAMKGKAVSFQIMDVKMNLETMSVADMGVNVATWPVSCLSNSEVDDKFRAQANESLKTFKDKVKSQGQMLMNLLEIALNR